MRISDPRGISRLVRDARLARGMTTQALAEAIGASRRWVVRFEADPSTARLDLVLAAVEAVGLAIDVSAPGARPVEDDADAVFRAVFGDG